MEMTRQAISRKSRLINAALLVLGFIFFLQSFASAQTVTLLHTFHGTDGANPHAALIQDSAGRLYSTTEFGGATQQDSGTVFRLSGTTFTLLYSFGGADDGFRPDSKLVRDSAGVLYGTTAQGGLQCQGYQCGVFFQLSGTSETTLHLFSGPPTDGALVGGIVRDSQGNFYGTTCAGGTYDRGTVFTVDVTGKESILYNFKGGFDGRCPTGMVRGSGGNLYGVTVGGGGSSACTATGTNAFIFNGCGTVWKLTNSNGVWTKTSLHRFKLTDGAVPQGRLIRDNSGNLYGTTQFGGSGNCTSGCGTVFKLIVSGQLVILNEFLNKANGYYPFAGLVRDSGGNLYGTSAYGGNTACLNGVGCGTVFKLDPAGNKTVLHKFTGSADGFNPIAELLLNETTHTLYGTTYLGGDQNCSTRYGGGPGCGVVFKIKYP